MSRRKTEAWLVENEDGEVVGVWYLENDARDQALELRDRAAERTGQELSFTVTPLMRRDPKAEAVVRAAVKWHQTRHEAGAHGGFNAELSELVTRDLKIAVHALQASQKKAKR